MSQPSDEHRAEIERVKAALLADIAASLASPTSHSTLDAVRVAAEERTGVPMVAQYSADGRTITVTPALRR